MNFYIYDENITYNNNVKWFNNDHTVYIYASSTSQGTNETISIPRVIGLFLLSLAIP
jgi:hypothetical protein